MADRRDYAKCVRWWRRVEGLTAIVSADMAEYLRSESETKEVEKAIEDGTCDASEWQKEGRIPIKFEVCGTCEGKGEYVNPAIDSHGITAQEMYDEGPDFIEDYKSGVYNTTCEHCCGTNVIPVPENAEQKKSIENWINSELQHAANDAYVTRMGF